MKLLPNHRFSCQFLLLSVVLLGAGTSHVWGQGKVDSLKQLLKTSTGTVKDDILYQLAYEVIDHDDRLGLEYATSALKTSLSNSDSLRIVRDARIRCLAFRRLNMIDSSLVLANKVLPIALRHHYNKEVRHLYNGIALVYNKKGAYAKALEVFIKTLNLNDRLETDSALSVTFNNIGFVYYNLMDYENARKYFLKAYNLKLRSGSTNDLEYITINLATCYVRTNETGMSEKFLAEALALCRIGCSDRRQVNIDFVNGAIAHAKKKLTQATGYHIKSYLLAKATGYEHFVIDNLSALFRILSDSHEDSLKQFLLRETEILFENNISHSSDLVELYHRLIVFHKKFNNIPKAFYFQTRYIELRDSVYSEQQTVNLMKLESEFLQRENKAKLENQAKVLKLNNEIIKRQEVLTGGVFIVLILLVFVVFLLFRSNRIKRQTNRILEDKVKDRTKELEQNRDELQRSLEENKKRWKTVSKRFNESVASMKGLCSLYFIENNDKDRSEYVSKIQNNLDDLLPVIGSKEIGKVVK